MNIETFDLFDFDKMLGDPKVEIKMNPKLPKYTYKVGKAEYSITDVKYLNETAVAIVMKSIVEMASGKEYATFDVTEIDEYRLEIVSDILASIAFKYRGGRGGTADGKLFGGQWLLYDDGKKILKQDFYKEYIEAIKKYAQDNDYNINYYDLAKVLSDDTMHRFDAQIWREKE